MSKAIKIMNAAADMMSRDYPNRKSKSVKAEPMPKETASEDQAPGEEEQEDFKDEPKQSQSNAKKGEAPQEHLHDKHKGKISNGSKEVQPEILKAKLPNKGHFKG